MLHLTAVPTMQTRLQKILSQWGIASRRQAEKMIQQGRVRVNGQIVHVGDTANSVTDRIEVDGQLIQPTDRPELRYLLLNKPAGVVCTCSDPRGRRTVLDLLPSSMQRRAENYHRSESALGDWFRRLRSRLGTKGAVTAAAHKLARILYAMVKTRKPYDPKRTTNQVLQKQRKENNLRRQAKLLGFQLTPIEQQVS